MKRFVIAALTWLVCLYTANAASLIFKPVAGSGGEQNGYAKDISCTRNWWAFGLKWSCDATIIDSEGKERKYHHNASALTPDDMGKQVPMTKQSVRTSRSSQGSMTWAPAEEMPGNKPLMMLLLFGFPMIALVVTFRLFGKGDSRRPTKPQPQPTPKFL